jgi:phosphatidylglycerol:prolipoprotein diacylglycerol transferase
VWPEIHRIWGVSFTLYDVTRATAIAGSLALCAFLNRRQGLSVRMTLLIAAVCAPVSILAARLLNAIEYGATWANLDAELLRNPGSSVYGALFACVLTVAGLTRLLQIPTLRFLDAGAPAIAVGEAISRIGCFAAGCCYGRPWHGPWAVVFPGNSFAATDERYRGLLGSGSSHSLPVHPVQLYAVVVMGFLTWMLIRKFQKPHSDGSVFFLLLIAYGVYRLFIAAFRVEVLLSMELFSLIFILAGTMGLLWSKRTRPAAV